MSKINQYFDTNELCCKCGCKRYIPNEQLNAALLDLREHFGVPVIVTSSTRCETHNAKVGGATGSQHLRGTAADVRVQGVPAEAVYNYLDQKYPDSHGIGLYEAHDFTHFDVRKNKARWRG